MIKKNLTLRLDDEEIKTTLYYPEGGKSLPVILMTPVLGKPVLETRLAKYLTRQGFVVFVTSFMPELDYESQVHDLKVHDRAYRKSIKGLRRLMKYADTLPFVKKGSFGLLGMSVGAIFTALNIKMNPSIKAAVIIEGGGDNPRILAYSHHPIMKRLRELRKEAFNLASDEDYEKFMDRHIQLDPLKIKREVDPEKILMFLSTNDSFVPTSAQLATWHHFREPELHLLKGGHFQGLLRLVFLEFKKVSNFFKLQLG